MGNVWVYATVFLAFISIPLNSIALLLLAALVGMLIAVARLWARYCLDRVEYSHSLNTYRAFAGEEIQLTTEVTNRKFLPLPWIQISDELPQDVAPLQGRTVTAPEPGRLLLTSFLSMRWYHRITRTYTLACRRRGHYSLGPVRIRSGDIFGMSTRDLRLGRDHLLAVYPKVLPLIMTRLPSREPYGSLRVRRSLIDDVTRPMGSREYAAGDSLRLIHWKSTARTGRLQTRVFDASTTPDYVLFYGVRTVNPPLLGSQPHLLELGVLTVAALANYGLENGHPVGLYVNQTSRQNSALVQAPPSPQPEQLTHILEALAQVHPDESIPLAQMVSERARSLPWGTTVIVVTAVPDEATIGALTSMRRTGWAVALVHIGGDSGSMPSTGIPVFTVSSAVAWQELEEVMLQ